MVDGSAGIADGVGGWSQVNIDAGVYSRTLMENAKAAATKTCLSPIAPQIVLEQAHMKTNVKVSSETDSSAWVLQSCCIGRC